MHPQSPSITDSNTIHNWSKKLQIDRFDDENRVNWSNFDVTILKFFEKFDHPFLHVFIWYTMFPESHGFVAMPVTSCIKDTVQICHYLICEERRNCTTLWPAQQRTVTLRKHVTKYKIMQKCVVEFFWKFDNCEIIIAWVSSILITKPNNLQLFTYILYGVEGPLWCWHL